MAGKETRRLPDEPLSDMSLQQTPSFMQRLRERWAATGSLLCVGIDPELERLPKAVRGGHTGMLALDHEAQGSQTEGALVTFNQAIIDATADLVCAFKPNSAFYEAYGLAGMRALIRTVTYIHSRYPDVPVILDAKRGDIGSTSAAYARATFDVIGADAVTLQPYLGQEAVQPFLDNRAHGCFILCRTSNPGSGEFQELLVRPDHTDPARRTVVEEPLYVRLAQQVATRWNARGNCGLVVGATYPTELRRVRSVVGDVPILVPGIGAQGGDLDATLRAGLDSHGRGLIISVTRSIIYASNGLDFAMQARREAQRLIAEINRLRRA